MFVSDKCTKYVSEVILASNPLYFQKLLTDAEDMLLDLTISEEGKGHYCAENKWLTIKVWGPTPEEAVMNYHRALLAGALRVKLAERA